MKAEGYNALAAINRSFDVTLESLTILKDQGYITVEYVQQQMEILEEHRAVLNSMLLNRVQTREMEDRDHFGKMRRTTETKLKE